MKRKDYDVPLEEIVRLSREKMEEKKRNVTKMEEMEVVMSTGKTRGRKSNKVVRFDIYDEDDDMVRLLKEVINEKNVMLYRVENYNLINSLKNRHSISFNSFLEWCDVLNMSAEISLVEKE